MNVEFERLEKHATGLYNKRYDARQAMQTLILEKVPSSTK
jgi:hypothetical protein